MEHPIAQYASLCARTVRNDEHLLSRLLALAADDADPMPLYRLASLCRRRGHIDLWIEGVHLAMRRPHCTLEQRLRRAHAKVTLGDWSGWEDWEVRLANPVFFLSPHTNYLRWSCRRWDGHESRASHTLLIVDEQGFGDKIQMLRFLPDLARRARTVVVVLPERLREFAEFNFGTMVTVHSSTEPYPSVDRYTFFMSLPNLAGKLPPFTPLRAPRPATRPPNGTGLRVGLCWAGSRGHHNDAVRSAPIAVCESLLNRSDVEWYSLYVGPRAEEERQYQTLRRPAAFTSFAETANFMTTLDGIVTVDTAVAHLAGTLDIPTVLMLPYASEWRWGLGRTTDWYPSMRIVRQWQPRDWKSAVSQAHAELDDIAKHLTVLPKRDCLRSHDDHCHVLP
jgi:Glycosyltransferase family 9 (heptosyltransferase)